MSTLTVPYTNHNIDCSSHKDDTTPGSVLINFKAVKVGFEFVESASQLYTCATDRA